MNHGLVGLPKKVSLLRQEYYDGKTPPWYNGYLHVVFTATFCLVSLGLAISLMVDFQWFYLLVFMLSFLFTSLKEYLLHRYPLHKKMKGISIAFYEHAGQHHGYFTHDAMEARHHKDFYRVFFHPLDILLFVIIMNVPIALALAAVFGDDIGLLHYLAGVVYFALYETLHYIYHSPESQIWHRLPVIKLMIQHHRRHHDKRLMGKYNFGVVTPVMDKFFSTYYKP